MLTRHSCAAGSQATGGEDTASAFALHHRSAIDPRLTRMTAREARRPGLGFPDLPTGFSWRTPCRRPTRLLLAEKKRSPAPSPEIVAYQHLPTFGMQSKSSFHRSEALSWGRVPAAQLRHPRYDSRGWKLLASRGLGLPC